MGRNRPMYKYNQDWPYKGLPIPTDSVAVSTSKMGWWRNLKGQNLIGGQWQCSCQQQWWPRSRLSRPVQAEPYVAAIYGMSAIHPVSNPVLFARSHHNNAHMPSNNGCWLRPPLGVAGYLPLSAAWANLRQSKRQRSHPPIPTCFLKNTSDNLHFLATHVSTPRTIAASDISYPHWGIFEGLTAALLDRA